MPIFFIDHSTATQPRELSVFDQFDCIFYCQWSVHIETVCVWVAANALNVIVREDLIVVGSTAETKREGAYSRVFQNVKQLLTGANWCTVDFQIPDGAVGCKQGVMQMGEVFITQRRNLDFAGRSGYDRPKLTSAYARRRPYSSGHVELYGVILHSIICFKEQWHDRVGRKNPIYGCLILDENRYEHSKHGQQVPWIAVTSDADPVS
mmetsp:Transcript_9258/g.26452  ORF Transcript_9258/g.26452 Transcript_9258/m.26452 type:complete len:207 (+) Transcript_9258:465-1085(+)